jgi:hypothetical protein
LTASKLGIRVRQEVYDYAQLARQHTSFLLFDPALSRRVVRSDTRCECDAGPTLYYESLLYALVIDDTPDFRLRTVRLPIEEDVIDWECKLHLI